MRTTLEEAREFFFNDKFAVENGAFIEEVGDGYAVCTVKLTKRHRNAMGAVMGGVYFTLADFAFAVAVNWRETCAVTLSSSINFLSSAKGDMLTARAKRVREGRRTCCYRIDVFDEQENLAATVTATGAVIK